MPHEMLNRTELVMFTSRKGADCPTVEAMRNALTANGFDAARAEEIAAAQAFRRAAQAAKKDCGSAEGEAADNEEETGKPAAGTSKLKVTCVEGDEKKVYGQIDKLTADPETRRIKRERVAGWILNATEDTDRKRTTYHVETTEGAVSLDLDHHLTHYAWADLTGIAREIMKKDCMGSYSPKANGSAYFVPTTGRDFLDRLESAFGACGFDVLRYGVPDTDSHRKAITSTIAQGIAADLAAHEEAIAGYGAETRPGVIRNRRTALTQSSELLDRINGTLQLGELRTTLAEKIAALFTACEAKLAVAEAAAAQPAAAPANASQPGQRRILTAAS